MIFVMLVDYIEIKNIEKMMDALIELHKENNNLKVCIVGFGEQENFSIRR